MPKMKNNKAVALLLVIGTIFVIVAFTVTILRTISDESRLTHHKVSRIQAYYAGLAGINYAYDKIRRGDWPLGLASTYTAKELTTIDPSQFPSSIRNVEIKITPRGSTLPNTIDLCSPPGTSTDDVCISVTVNFLYQ